jgi:hypothetical protein
MTDGRSARWQGKPAQTLITINKLCADFRFESSHKFASRPISRSIALSSRTGRSCIQILCSYTIEATFEQIPALLPG